MNRRRALGLIGIVVLGGAIAALATLPRGALSGASVELVPFGDAAEPVFPGETWESQHPASLGLDPEKLSEFRRTVGRGSYGCVVRGGYVVERWDTWVPPVLASWRGWASASKPFVGALALFAIQEGRLSGLDAPVETFGWNLRDEDRGMTVRHLVDMTSGYSLPEGPGERYAYNDYGTKLFVLSLVERLYGLAPDDAEAVEELLLDPERLGPLQFEDRPFISVRQGAPRLNMSPCDYARFGLLLLNQGNWAGQQVLREDLVQAFLRPGVPPSLRRTVGGASDDYLQVGTAGGGNDLTAIGPGVYGYFWWFNVDGQLWPDVPHGAFQGNGHRNRHSLTVIPELDIVVAWRESRALASDGDAFHVEMNRALKLLVQAVGGLDGGEGTSGGAPGRRGVSAAPASPLSLEAARSQFG
jgi:CubicO group peptidase (beta-lactamase class C family)